MRYRIHSGSIGPAIRKIPWFGVVWRSKGTNLTLLEAVRANDVERVRVLLATGTDPNAKDANDAYALMYAALYSGPGMLNLLIAGGADLKLQDKNGLTALVTGLLEEAVQRIKDHGSSRATAWIRVDSSAQHWRFRGEPGGQHLFSLQRFYWSPLFTVLALRGLQCCYVNADGIPSQSYTHSHDRS